MDTSALQTDTEHPTGSVQVSLKQGSPSFDIVEGVAYDFIEPPTLQSQVKNCKIMYHGSLAMRSPMTRQTILGLRKDTGLPVFVDVNLRAPFWDTDLVRGLINGADWVKLNDEEILLLSDDNTGELTDMAVRFREENSIQGVIVTLGEQGAFIVTENDLVKVDAGPVTKLVDTVGAGDGFSAMTIAGLLQGWDLREVLEAASLFAAKICGLRGALSRDRAFYDDFLDEIH
jgi:fructokinase